MKPAPPRLPQRFSVLGVPMLFALVVGLRAYGGPPFLTDDPQPVDYQHWEAYLFSTIDATQQAKTGLFPALEFNYGAAPDLQLHVVLPWAFSSPSGGWRESGLGDASLGLKFRFLSETETHPQVGIFPMVSIPSGDSKRGLGGGGSTIFLPVWIQKSSGPWTIYGGGGYTINRAPGGCSYFSGGWLLQRDLGGKLALGAELFAQGRSSGTDAATTILNVGGQVNFSAHFSILFSAGSSVAGARHCVAYFGLYWTWGPRGTGQPGN